MSSHFCVLNLILKMLHTQTTYHHLHKIQNPQTSIKHSQRKHRAPNPPKHTPKPP
ncbi:hypothetical protein Hanom_Chr00s000357g01638861 [Helianthus anomalus]